MPVEQRQEQFKHAVREALGVAVQLSESYGLSNSGRFVEGALLSKVNLENGIGEATEAWCNVLTISVNAESEVHVAIVVRTALHELQARLDEMLANQEVEFNHPVLGPIQPYHTRNNNTNVYLTSGAVIHTASRNLPLYFDASLGEMLGNPIQADHVYYAVHPPTLSARNHPSITGTIQDLRSMVGNRLSELYVWPTEPVLPESMFHMPSTIPLEEVRHRVEALGGYTLAIS